MADVEFTSKRGDRSPAIRVQLQRGDGTIVDLTAKLLSQLTFHIKNIETGVVVSAIATTIIVPETNGEATLTPTAAMVLFVGDFQIEVEYEDPAASGITETFPVCDRFIWHIVPDIA